MGEETAAVRETNDLCRDIASTRRRIEERADALRDRLSTKELVRPVTDRLRETLGVGGEKILDAFRENPVPLTLVGIGLGWLMLKDSGYLYRAGPAGRRGTGLRSVAKGAREAAHQVGDAAGAVSETVGDVAGAVSERVGEAAHRTGEAARHATAAVREGASRTADWFSRTLEESPLALAAGAMAAGLVAGLAIPVTEKEREALGQIGEQLAQKVLEQTPQGGQPTAQEAPRAEAPAPEPRPTAEGALPAPAPQTGQGTNPGSEPQLG